MAWTTANLITAVKDRQMFPDASSGSLSPAVLLQYATDELLITIVPMLMKLREKYYETYIDFDYSEYTPTVDIPHRSIGTTLSAVQFISGDVIRPINPIDPSNISTMTTSTIPSNFYFQNNSVVFYPAPAGAYGTVRLRYFQRPSSLALTTDCAQITAFDPLTGVATCVPPSQWITGDLFDFVPRNASQATPYNIDSVITAISTSSMTFTLTEAQAALVRVGDWIALAGYTPVPEVPFELQAVLTQATCCRGLAAIKDQAGLESAKIDLNAYLLAAVNLLTPRDQLGLKKVVSNWRQF